MLSLFLFSILNKRTAATKFPRLVGRFQIGRAAAVDLGDNKSGKENIKGRGKG